MEPPASAPLPLGPETHFPVLSVSRLVTAARVALERRLGLVWVGGEISMLFRAGSGHLYFVLKDDAAQVRCTLFRQKALLVAFELRDGMAVEVLGKPAIYEAKGEFQLNVSRLIPTSTIGAAQQEFERVKALLHRDGLFDPARKRPLPELAATLAVVTSTAGAALRDIITVARRRWPCARLLVIDARVQGDGAVEALVRALTLVNRLEGIDLCIVGRGGGGREDLTAFNAEIVCRALAAVRVPTISAVGHETDISLTDLVADVRAPTPSAAAELALADGREVRRQLDDLAARMAGALAGRTRLGAERVERAGDRLHAALTAGLERRRQQLVRLSAQLDALSPLRVLQRGYAVPAGPDGRVLKHRAEFVPGEPFTLRVADGTVAARVEPR